MQRRGQHKGSGSGARKLGKNSQGSSFGEARVREPGSSGKSGGSSRSKPASGRLTTRNAAVSPTDVEYTGSGFGRGKGAFTARAKTTGNLTGQDLQRWDFKQINEAAAMALEKSAQRNAPVNGGGKAKGGGRGRGAKRAAAYSSLSAYSAHFTELVSLELQCEKEVVYERLLRWTPAQLTHGGYALMRLVGMPRGRLFREHVVRFSLPPLRGREAAAAAGGGGGGARMRRPALPFHRFTAGDVIAITAGDKPPNPAAAEGSGGDVKGGGHLEGIVLERTPYFLDVVVKQLPDGLASAARSGGGGGGSGALVMSGSTSLFRLDQFVNGVSYERQYQALRSATAPDAGFFCQSLRGLLVDCLAATLEQLEEAGGGAAAAGMLPLDLQRQLADAAAQGEERGALGAFAKLARESVQLGYSRADVDAVVRPMAEAGDLNDIQVAAVKQALDRRLTLIQGPPGTGKTRTACRILAAAVQLRRGKRAPGRGKVLATAFSNVAADNVLDGCLRLGLRCVRVGRPAAVRPDLWGATLDAQLENHPELLAVRDMVSRKTATLADGKPGKSSTQAGRDLRALQGELEAAERRAVRAILEAADVVVCSCIGAGGEQLAAASEQCEETGAAAGLTFSTVLIDEATQATEPASLVPLTRGCEQLILVGDQNQLPPTILSRGAAAGGLATSLFARLMLAGVAPVVLARQYRMHPRIAAFPGARFYGGRLASAPRAVDRPTPRGFPWPNAAVPVAFVAVRDDSDGARGLEARGSGGATAEDGGGGATSWCNAREAAAACAVVRALLRGGGGGGDVAPQDVGVITPYAAQVRVLTDALRAGLGCTRAAPAAPDGAATAAAAVAHSDADQPAAAAAQSSRGGGDGGGGGAGAERGGGRKRTAAPPRAPQPWELIEVRSVDGYQGREKEVIVLSAVRSNRCGAVGFLSDWRRLNVAITRARRGVVIVGDPATLSHDAHWRAYIAWCAENGALMTERDLRRALQQQQQPGGSGDAQQ